MTQILAAFRRLSDFFDKHQGLEAIFWLVIAIFCVAAIEPTYTFFKGFFVTTADGCILAHLDDMQTDGAVRALATICQRTYPP